MKKKSVDIITLGCSKNFVDSERLVKMFNNVDYIAHHNPDKIKSKIVIINTCGFIGDAKEESINTILQFVDKKNNGKISQLYVMGCLSERYKEELISEIPEVDGWYGKFDWESIVDLISKLPNNTKSYERAVTTPSHYAYIKIAEGCNRFCAFCAIPLITGRYKSREIEDILSEIKLLVQQGVKEFNILAQDLSNYGMDIYGSSKLAELIDKIATTPGVKWVRLHYAYPTQFPYDVLDVIAKHDNVCKYLDIALQHISDNVLDNMRRHIDGKTTKELIKTIRQKVPSIHLRTTLMVGFPGEGEQEFEELMEFVKEARFERMGAFAYCEEDDTYASKKFPDNISSDVKDERLAKLMAIQEDIAFELNQQKIGKVFNVIIDREEEEYYVGRTEWDSPEVDPEVLIQKENIKLDIGEFYNVKIIDALPFELIGTISN
ncbi:MAG: 30S ribosomal protein S12 methylthiotransferase RimO [Muribaculaceae bacterium]|nr:30S ribosomal protein S12 methylthiotransferase RimO [Muribaculaceae bacterium]